MDPHSFGTDTLLNITQVLGLFPSISLLIFLTLIYALLSASEILMLSGRGGLLQEDRELKSSIYKAISHIEKLSISLPAIQFGLSLSALSVGWLAANIFLIIISRLNISSTVEVSAFFIFFFFSLVTLHAVIGGLISKTLTLQFVDSSISALARPASFLISILSLGAYFVSLLANKILKIWNTSIPTSVTRIQSTEDLTALVSQGMRTGVIDKEKEKMFKGLVGFSDTVAREVMTARTDVISIPVDSSLSEVIEIVKEQSYSRYPVHGANADDIIGILLSKDLLDFLSSPTNNENNFRVNKLMREPYFVQGSKAIDSLLSEFRQRKLHIAIVLDEHGGVDGLVTLEDLLEEIVGDIYDELDSHDNDIQHLEDGSLIVDGGVLVADLNQKYPLGIPEGDYDTIAGFIFNALDRMPKEGDRVEIEGYYISALKVVAHRIETVKISRKSEI